MRWIVLAIIGLIISFGVGLSIRLGAFKSVEIEIAQVNELKLIYKEHIGAYHKVVPVIQEVETWAQEHGVNCDRSYGEYLDDPEKVDEVRLRSHGGCVVSEIPSSLPSDFHSEVKLAGSFVKAVFTGSPSIGPFKVYPRVKTLAQERRIALQSWVLEIYEIHSQESMTTTYLFPIKPEGK